MALGFRGGSAEALAALRQQLDGVGDLTRAGEDLFAVAALRMRSYSASASDAASTSARRGSRSPVASWRHQTSG